MKSIVVMSLALFVGNLAAQIPDPSFENWVDKSYDKPDDWGLYGKAKKVAGYKSANAAKLERDTNLPQLPGALFQGMPGSTGIGGIPFVSYPDTFVGYFKVAMEAGDTGFALVYIKKWGKIIGTGYLVFLGNDSNNWVRMSAEIYYTDTGYSDTLVLVIAANNPNKSFMNSWIIVDSLHFSGGVLQDIPNGNFEAWDHIVRYDPQLWFSTNGQAYGYDPPVSRSTDKVFGSYSVRIQNVDIGTGIFPGYILAGGQGAAGPTPGFAVDQVDTMFFFNYKFQPENQDTMSIGVLYYDSGVLVGAAFYISGDVQNTWKEVGIPVSYIPQYSGIPDSATIFCAAFQGGENPTGESVLLVDGLRRNIPMNSTGRVTMSRLSLAAFPNPGKDKIALIYTLKSADNTRLELYNQNGERIWEMRNEVLAAGSYSDFLEVGNITPGLYFCRLTTTSGFQVIQILVQH